jgi:hypothetical protein
MFIKTANICPPNSKLIIEFEIDGNTVSVVARVMWAKKVPQNLLHLVKKAGMGVRFLRFERGEQHFNNYFDSLNTTPQDACKHVQKDIYCGDRATLR